MLGSSPAPLLSLRLTVGYPNRAGVLRDVALDIAPGEILGLVGESGSGKSTLALAIMRLLDHKSASCEGQLAFNGRNLLQLRPSEMRSIRGREIGMILQSPIASLNPVLKIGTQMAEAWRAHQRRSAREWRVQALDVLRRVQLDGAGELLDLYPRQLSVGQAQRVLIAMSILHRPRLLIADEPTSALDAITGAEILTLFKMLSRELNMALLFISHDLLSVARLCDRVAILDHGAIVESGPAETIFRTPSHRYTRALLDAIPRPPVLDIPIANLARAVSESGRAAFSPETVDVESLRR